MGILSRTWTLTKVRLLLATRNRAFFFFSLVMPLIFLVGAVIFVGQRTQWAGYILGAILTTTVMGSFWGLSVQLVTFREQGILRRFRIAPELRPSEPIRGHGDSVVHGQTGPHGANRR